MTTESRPVSAATGVQHLAAPAAERVSPNLAAMIERVPTPIDASVVVVGRQREAVLARIQGLTEEERAAFGEELREVAGGAGAALADAFDSDEDNPSVSGAEPGMDYLARSFRGATLEEFQVPVLQRTASRQVDDGAAGPAAPVPLKKSATALYHEPTELDDEDADAAEHTQHFVSPSEAEEADEPVDWADHLWDTTAPPRAADPAARDRVREDED